MNLLCQAIAQRKRLAFEYDGLYRLVDPYCHGFTARGSEVLRAVQVAGESRSGGLGVGKLWSVEKIVALAVSDQAFEPNDPNYNPQDSVMKSIHCQVYRHLRLV